MSAACVFCSIVAGAAPADIVWEDALTLAFLDLRQFHPGHTLVIPRRHLADVRELDAATGAALMACVVRVSRAVAAAFAPEGLSLWHSIGAGADQEVPHLHLHVHPRLRHDGLLRVYPAAPALPEPALRQGYAARLRAQLHAGGGA